jgi:hypothetical protein
MRDAALVASGQAKWYQAFNFASLGFELDFEPLRGKDA